MPLPSAHLTIFPRGQLFISISSSFRFRFLGQKVNHTTKPLVYGFLPNACASTDCDIPHAFITNKRDFPGQPSRQLEDNSKTIRRRSDSRGCLFCFRKDPPASGVVRRKPSRWIIRMCPTALPTQAPSIQIMTGTVRVLIWPTDGNCHGQPPLPLLGAYPRKASHGRH